MNQRKGHHLTRTIGGNPVFTNTWYRAMNYLGNVGTAPGMTFDWFTGTGSNNKTFVNDNVANAFRNAPGIIKARNEYYSNGKTFGDPGFNLNGLVNAGIDPIEQFVGSYHYQINVINNNLQFTITNKTSFGSFFYGITPYSWNWSSGPMSDFKQTYIFTEPIRKP